MDEYDYNESIDLYEFKIEELKQQLVKSEEKIDELETQSLIDIDHISYYQSQYLEIKDQLEEKEKEIENIKLCRCVNCTNEYEFMLEGLVEDLEKQIDKDTQDKISFAVEQLEKVKEWVHNTASYVLGDYASVYEDDLLDEIDNQIKQLKEME